MRTKYLPVLLILMAACTNETEAKRVLDLDGVTNVEITGYKFFACSESDFYHTGFKGMRNEKPISGVVCSGLLFKASTVRY